MRYSTIRICAVCASTSSPTSKRAAAPGVEEALSWSSSSGVRVNGLYLGLSCSVMARPESASRTAARTRR